MKNERSPKHSVSRRFLTPLTVLVIISMAACNLPGMVRPLPTASPTPSVLTPIPTAAATPTSRPKVDLPPALVEASPLPGSEIALKAPLVLAFNQPMDQASVEGALQGQPTLSGKITWSDSSTLQFTPDQPLLPATKVSLTINTNARAANGLAFTAPVTINYTTAEPLSLTQSLPEDGTQDAAPTSAIVVAFNRPVVALGAEAANNPAAFSLTPPAAGHGEWLNTSTYIYYPDPGLAGATSYKVQLNSSLVSTEGAPLDQTSKTSWSFKTTSPKVDSVEPVAPARLALDGPVVVNFNIAMDPASMASNFTLKDSTGNPVAGKTTWNDSHTSLTFKPDALLARATHYTLTLSGQAQAFGGAPLGRDFSVTFQTYPNFSVISTTPARGQVLENNTTGGFGVVSVIFSSPLKSDSLGQFLSLSPAIGNYAPYTDPSTNQAFISGYYLPSATYTLTVSANLEDAWGEKLGKPYSFSFNTQPAAPALVLQGTQSGTAVFLTTADTGLSAQATNLKNLSLTRSTLTLSDLMALLGPNGYDLMQSYKPTNPVTWTQSLSLTPDRSQVTSISVSKDGKSLPAGLYFLSISSPELVGQAQSNLSPVLLVVSPSHLTFKMSADQAFVWAVKLENNTPMSGAAISIYDQDNNLLASGKTDDQGLFQVDITAVQDPYQTFYAVLGKPGDKDFSLALTGWSQGLAGYDFGLATDYTGPNNMAYIYTDRPIYQPGQAVNFRAVVRKANNGRYTLPDLGQVNVKILGDGGMSGQQPQLFNQDLPLSAYGTLSGTYTLPVNANPGYYQIALTTGTGDNATSYLSFQVANYVKPQINVQVQLTPGEIQSGQTLTGKVDAQYFFGAPAGGLAVSWTLYRQPTNINLPQYQTGPLDTTWMEPYWMLQPYSSLGSAILTGQDTTAPDGSLTIPLSADQLKLNATDSTQSLTLEVTIQDENGQPVSQRASALMHPSDFYIGVRPDAWSSQAGSPLGFSVQTVDWKSQPTGNKALVAQFSKIVWVEQPKNSIYDTPTYTAQTTLVSSANPTTDASGQARLSFTPPDPGTYQLDVTSGTAHTQVLVWVAGPGSATWPNLTNQQLHLTADASQYQAGQTAKVFIPNPLGKNTQALITLERGRVMNSQVITLSDAGMDLAVPLSNDDAPNVYLSVTLIGHTPDGNRPDYRQGYLNLQVEPTVQTLKVDVSVSPQHATAGQTVTISIKVSDAQGKPVQGEFSIGVADLAALVLADPNAPDILPAFYGIQPLGVRTALSLNSYGGSTVPAAAPGGRGGGGGGSMAQGTIRENFQDTAFWNPTLVTGPDGMAKVSVTLPDNLTTWQVDVRGLTTQTQVGQATTQLVTSKDLLVRPQTPSFMVVGDHTALAAIVNNNTAASLDVDVALQANGFTLDDPTQSIQKVSVPANGHASVTWWGTAQDVPAIDLVFKASSGNLEDQARPEQGKLPVLHYSSPQTFSTAGVLTDAGNRLEVVSLPRSFTPTGGSLSLELTPSLAAALVAGLKSLDNPAPDDVVALLASFLPNLETAQALKALGVDAPDLQANLQQKVSDGIIQLLNRQNSDGGWIWWSRGSDPSAASDPYITAYVLFGLAQAGQAGYNVPSDALDRAKQFLSATVFTPKASDQSFALDRLAFIVFALQTAGDTDLTGTAAANLYEVRNHLSPWAQALDALVLDATAPGDERVKTLISDLETSAIRSATGAHWETADVSWEIPGTPILTTGIVLYALAQKDPASSLTPDVLRYLMANSNSSNAWDSAYETAWVLMGLTEALKGTGELQASYNYNVTLNGSPLANGQAGGPNGLTTVTSTVPLSALDPSAPNALQFSRDAGSGRLYYRADLQVDRPVESAMALSLGLSLERAYFLAGQDCTKVNCQPISEIQLASGVQTQAITVRLTVTLPHDMYNLMVEDSIPAGTAIFNPNLNTSQQGLNSQPSGLPSQSGGLPAYDPGNPYQYGWGWWIFNGPQIYTDHVLWTASYVPAGTYQLTYTLIPTSAGEFRVIPAHAWEAFFPEVQGTTAGAIFAIKP
jgi:uncharacterized protein YfaS (alpha-2-macroglobulin family)